MNGLEEIRRLQTTAGRPSSWPAEVLGFGGPGCLLKSSSDFDVPTMA
jgi:hypothetical protein